MGDNAALMRRWFRDVWRPGGEATVDELLASDATGVMEDRQVHGRSRCSTFSRRITCS